MTLDQLGNIGEFLGAIAVVLSLGYVAIQIRQNTRAVHSATYQGLEEILHSLGLTLSDSPDLARILVKAHADFASLTAEEQVRFDAFVGRVFGTWENAFFHRQQGFLAEEIWQSWVAAHLRYVTTPPFLRWWKEEKGRFIEAFQKYVDDALASAPKTSSQRTRST